MTVIVTDGKGVRVHFGATSVVPSWSLSTFSRQIIDFLLPLEGHVAVSSCGSLFLPLSRFSRVRLCAIPETAAHQAPPIPGILQARTLEWVAISFSNVWKWKVKVKSLSRVRLFATPWTAAHQAPLSMGFSRQEYWSGVPLPSPSLFLDLRKKSFCLIKHCH